MTPQEVSDQIMTKMGARTPERAMKCMEMMWPLWSFHVDSIGLAIKGAREMGDFPHLGDDLASAVQDSQAIMLAVMADMREVLGPAKFAHLNRHAMAIAFEEEWLAYRGMEREPQDRLERRIEILFDGKDIIEAQTLCLGCGHQGQAWMNPEHFLSGSAHVDKGGCPACGGDVRCMRPD